ncbi:MAG: TIM44-like domain-containing protein [Deltaproteobacteria bacterium]|jgi:predicted lipid-binding transport protein (Tim44 family)|nr:TIM44-like domain-containing protein [Deltaproteobacteria bacterium]
MKKFLLFIFLPFLLVGSFTLCGDFAVPEAEAARFGGGRSFGGNRSYRQPAQAPGRQQAAPAQNNAVGRNAAPASGLGGFFGPLLAGSMLGALFFGGGFHGFGMADVVIIMLGVFLLNRFIRSRRRAAELAAAGANGGASYHDAHKVGADGGNAWDRLRGNPAFGRAETGPRLPEGAEGPEVPEGFDTREFLAGAKLMFTRMQEAWDQRDLEDIAEFTTAPVLEEITRQAGEDPTPSQTDILLVKASLLEVGRDGSAKEAAETASVCFEVLMRERREQESFEMREVWHFLRENGGSWKLDGIQQIA